jgi:K+-sensing histidine kinase KdpD
MRAIAAAIVDTIARAHGGSAKAVNRPGGGADVWLALPLNSALEHPQAPAASEPLSSSATSR